MNKTILNLTRTWAQNTQTTPRSWQSYQNETDCYNRHRKGGLKAFCHNGPYMLDMYKSFGAVGNPEHYAIIIQRSWRKLLTDWDGEPRPDPVEIDKNFFFFESLKQPGFDIPYEECDLHRSARLLQRKWRKWSGHVFHYFYDCLAPEEVLDRSARLIQRRWRRWQDWVNGGTWPPEILLIDFELRPEFGWEAHGGLIKLFWCDMCKDPMRKNGTLSICQKCQKISEDKPTPVIEEDPPDWDKDKIAAVAIIRLVCKTYNGDIIKNNSVSGRWSATVLKKHKLYQETIGVTISMKFFYSVVKDIGKHFLNHKIGSYECNETKMIERYDRFTSGDEELFTDNIINVPILKKSKKKIKGSCAEKGSPQLKIAKPVSPEVGEVKNIIKYNTEFEFKQTNPKKKGSKIYDAYELYKVATNYKEFIAAGGQRSWFLHEFRAGIVKLV